MHETYPEFCITLTPQNGALKLCLLVDTPKQLRNSIY